jgi:hypothetical protein
VSTGKHNTMNHVVPTAIQQSYSASDTRKYTRKKHIQERNEENEKL